MTIAKDPTRAANLKDYSGSFRPDLTLEDFDKDLLVRMWHKASLCFVLRMAEWYYPLKDKYGSEVAKDISRDVWIKGQALDLEERCVAGGVNIPDRDVLGLLKSMQWDMGQQGTIDTTLELVDNNPYHGRATIHSCTAYNILWASGDFELLEFLCDEVCLYGYEQVARWYNPHIQSVTMKLPPFHKTEKKDEMPCQCEFFLPGKSGRVDLTSIDDYDGPELDGYTGPFMPGQNTNETAKKFSKKTIIGIIEGAGKLEAALPGLFMTATAAKLGKEVACEMDRVQSRNSVITDMGILKEEFNISGDDVGTLLKYCQCAPVRLARMPESEFDLKDGRHGTMTVKRCRTLDYCKKLGRTELQEHMCRTICVEGFQAAAEFVNPGIKVTPLKLPKRQRNAWEIWKEERVTDAEQARALVRELMVGTDWPALGPVECQWEFKLD
jgi:hypothetical protein